MAPQYRLLDEDEDLNSLLGPPDYASLQPTASEMSPSPQQGQSAGGGFQMPPRDPELEDAWKGLEMQKIHEAQKPEYGWAEGLRDTVPTLLALGMDAGFNHGRGAGQIVQGGMGEVAKQEALRNKERLDAGDLAVKLHGRNNDPLAYLRAQTAAQNAGTNATRTSNTQQRWTDQGDPASDHSKGTVVITGQKAGSAATGRLTAEHELVDQTAGDKARIAGDTATSSTNATTDALAENPRAITAEEGVRNELAQKQLENELAKQATALEDKHAQQKIANVSKYNKELGDVILIASQAHKLQNQFDAHPDDAPGVGPWDSRKPDFMKSPDDIETEQAFATFSNPQFKDIAGRAVTGAEGQRVLQQAGNLKSTNEQTVRNAVKAIAEIAGNRIRAGSHGREDIAREILRDHGLESLLGDAQPDPADAMPEAPPEPDRAPNPLAGARELPLPGAGMPNFNHDGVPTEDLGDTGGYRLRDAPPGGNLASQSQVRQVQQAGGLVTVRLNGKTAQVPRAQAEAMRAMNPAVQF